MNQGLVAQWTRARGYEPRCRGFESLLARCTRSIQTLQIILDLKVLKIATTIFLDQSRPSAISDISQRYMPLVSGFDLALSVVYRSVIINLSYTPPRGGIAHPGGNLRAP